MTSLPGGHSATAELRRQVLVVEEDPKRCQDLCTLLAHQGLAVHSVRPADISTEPDDWPGVILVSDRGHGSVAWKVVQAIRSRNVHVPILLLCTVREHLSDIPQSVQVYLPYEVPDALLVQEVTWWVDRAEHGSSTGDPERGPVLVIDDDARIRSILQQLLELKGFTVLTADSGEEGLMQVSCGGPRVVLLDIRLPGMDGLLTLKHLRTKYPQLPVVMISNSDDQESRETAKRLGVRTYLVKPFQFDRLEQALLLQLRAEPTS